MGPARKGVAMEECHVGRVGDVSAPHTTKKQNDGNFCSGSFSSLGTCLVSMSASPDTITAKSATNDHHVTLLGNHDDRVLPDQSECPLPPLIQLDHHFGTLNRVNTATKSDDVHVLLAAKVPKEIYSSRGTPPRLASHLVRSLLRRADHKISKIGRGILALQRQHHNLVRDKAALLSGRSTLNEERPATKLPKSHSLRIAVPDTPEFPADTQDDAVAKTEVILKTPEKVYFPHRTPPVRIIVNGLSRYLGCDPKPMDLSPNPVRAVASTPRKPDVDKE